LNSGLWATVNGGPIPPITAKATIRGYTVSVTAHPVAYHWDMGNGSVMLGTSAGSQDHPSIDYVYQKSGTYTLSLTVTWTGTYTFGGNGIASETSALGPVDQAPQQLSWPVQQIRSVLIAPGAPDTTTTIAVANGC
jgi:PKD repeat protein